MTLFESLLALLLAAVVLLQVARRAALPYPAMLAMAGVLVAFLPGAPTIRIDPQTALALFIAPVLLDAAYDFPLAAARTLWRPLLVLAAGAVLATAAAVALIGVWVAGLPLAAACVLGAIVAPPDAAAATAVLGAVSLPRRTVGVLKGESLFNDGVALLLFNAALLVQSRGGLSAGTGLQLALAVPGGVLVGVGFGLAMRSVSRFVANTLGGTLLQFLGAFAVWIAAERLHLSAVLASVACAMTVARGAQAVGSPRMRVHSFAVWASVVFVLNVLAFLLMGMQARLILERMSGARLVDAARVAGLVILAVTCIRFLVVMGWTRLAARFPALRGELPPPTVGQGVVVAWSGMRGLVTLGTAFALPASFPQRDLVVLTAFAVVLTTLVVQGLTLAPLIKRLGLDRMEDPAADLRSARLELARVGLAHIDAAGPGADLALGDLYRLKVGERPTPSDHARLTTHRQLGLSVVQVQRQALQGLRSRESIDIDAFYLLQAEIDWRELTLLPDDQRRIDEI